MLHLLPSTNIINTLSFSHDLNIGFERGKYYLNYIFVIVFTCTFFFISHGLTSNDIRYQVASGFTVRGTINHISLKITFSQLKTLNSTMVIESKREFSNESAMLSDVTWYRMLVKSVSEWVRAGWIREGGMEGVIYRC